MVPACPLRRKLARTRTYAMTYAEPASVRLGIALVSDRPVDELVSLALVAETVGFSDVWLTDLQLTRRDVYISLGAMAAATERVRLGPMVTNPSTRHLSVTASAMATLDELSDGRAACGIGAGRAAVRAIGAQEATLDDCRRAVGDLCNWFGGGTVERDGTSTVIGEFGRRPIPVLLSASGPRMLELGGEVADGVIFVTGASPALARYAHAAIDAGAARRAVSGKPFKVHYVPCLLPDAGDDAREQAQAVAKFHASVLPLPADVAGVPRLTADGSDPHDRASSPTNAELDHAVVEQFVLCGSHEDIARQVDELLALGVDQLALWPLGEPQRFIETFAAEVVPRLNQEAGVGA